MFSNLKADLEADYGKERPGSAEPGIYIPLVTKAARVELIEYLKCMCRSKSKTYRQFWQVALNCTWAKTNELKRKVDK